MNLKRIIGRFLKPKTERQVWEEGARSIYPRWRLDDDDWFWRRLVAGEARTELDSSQGFYSDDHEDSDYGRVYLRTSAQAKAFDAGLPIPSAFKGK